MKFYVTYRIDARYVAEVDAPNYKAALKAAESEFSDADFGAAEDIDGEPVIVEDEDDIVWEKE